MGASSPRRTLACLTIAAALVLAGCSDDDGGDASSPTTAPATGEGPVDINEVPDLPAVDPDEIDGGEQAYVDALAESFQASGGGASGFTDEQAECLAPLWVDIIGIEDFAASGLTPEVLASQQAGLEALALELETTQQMIDAFPACDVVPREALLAQLRTVASQATGEGELPAEVDACLEEAITDDLARSVLARLLAGTEDPSSLLAPVDACFQAYAEQVEGQQPVPN